MYLTEYTKSKLSETGLLKVNFKVKANNELNKKVDCDI